MATKIVFFLLLTSKTVLNFKSGLSTEETKTGAVTLIKKKENEK